MSNFRDGPPGGNAMVSGPTRERLAEEFAAAQRERIDGKAAEQKHARDQFYARKRLATETSKP